MEWRGIANKRVKAEPIARSDKRERETRRREAKDPDIGNAHGREAFH